MNSNHILELFKNGHKEKAFKELYKLYPKIEKLILSKGGQKQDALDIFQDALIVLYRKLESSNFKLTSSFYTYLYSVSRFIWNDTQKSNSKIIKKGLNERIEIDLNEEKKYKKAEYSFSQLGERCKQLLILFYYKELPFKKIAQLMQFSSEKIAKNEKYKCLSKARLLYKNSIKPS